MGETESKTARRQTAAQDLSWGGTKVIPNQWYAVLEASEIPRGRPLAATRLGQRLAFWRDETGRIGCLRQQCPHRGASLSSGSVVGGELACPFHGFRFTPDGNCTLVPSTGSAKTPPAGLRADAVPAIEAHGFVFVWHGSEPPEPSTPRFFDDLGTDMVHAGSHKTWHAHYARMIENQLDVAHLPFVHHNTIGRGGKSLVDGPLIEWLDQDRFRVYVFNRVDDGTPPLRAAELTRPEAGFHLEFVFPNLWQNYLGENMRIVAAFAPIDEETSVLYLRTYQRLPLPAILGRLVCRLSMPANNVIAGQDRRVVETQRPLRPELRGSERLVKADGPIIAYRRRRAELESAVALHSS